jgi:predicted RND superfamily exporter protein
MVRLALRRPGVMLAVWGLLFAFSLPGLARLQLRTDGRSLVPPKAPAVLVDRQVRQTFGLRDPLLVLIEPADPRGVYNPATLHLLADLTTALRALPGLGPSHVRSLATERGNRYDRVRRDFRPLFEPFPETPERLVELQKEVTFLDLPVGLLVSADGSAATILVEVPPVERLESDERFELWRQVDATARRFAAQPRAGVRHRIAVVGAPAAETLLGRYILSDLRLLVPAALALVAILLYVALRSHAAVALGLAKVGVCLCVLFGGMGWVGEPIFLSTAILPVILVAVGLADEIHLLARYLELLREGHPEGRAREQTFAELGNAVILALLTTITGFASFVLAPIPALAHFGVIAAIGVALCLLFSLTATPAILALLPAGRFGSRRPATLALGQGGMVRPGRRSQHRSAGDRLPLRQGVSAVEPLLPAGLVPEGVRGGRQPEVRSDRHQGPLRAGGAADAEGLGKDEKEGCERNEPAVAGFRGRAPARPQVVSHENEPASARLV